MPCSIVRTWHFLLKTARLTDETLGLCYCILKKNVWLPNKEMGFTVAFSCIHSFVLFFSPHPLFSLILHLSLFPSSSSLKASPILLSGCDMCHSMDQQRSFGWSGWISSCSLSLSLLHVYLSWIWLIGQTGPSLTEKDHSSVRCIVVAAYPC